MFLNPNKYIWSKFHLSICGKHPTFFMHLCARKSSKIYKHYLVFFCQHSHKLGIITTPFSEEETNIEGTDLEFWPELPNSKPGYSVTFYFLYLGNIWCSLVAWYTRYGWKTKNMKDIDEKEGLTFKKEINTGGKD